jgi:uncharacterized protein YegJ (DUF2314 family)
MLVTRGTRILLALAAISLISLSCSNSAPKVESNSRAKASTPKAPIAAGELRDEHIKFQFAIYYLPQPNKDPLAELQTVLQDKSAKFRQVEKLDGKENSPTVAARLETNPKAEYAPPDLQSLQYFGRGLSRDQAESLQNTKSALVLNFGYSQEHVWSGLRSSAELTGALARATGGLIWDETTREVFSPDAWQERRIDSWTEEFPDVSKFTVIHAYKHDDDEFVRCITLGMAKFGLPDVVIDNSSWSRNRMMGHTINLFAQAIAEGAVLRKAGEFDLNFKSIKNAAVREPQLASLKPNATAVALLSLREGTREEGDPPNRLIEITFDRGTGPDTLAKQEQVLSAALGWEDAVTQVKHDDALKAASRQARTKLPALRAASNKGLAPGEFIQVKAPFDTPAGGREWMWVEVTSWNGDKIKGLLQNEPVSIPSLHGGQIVEVSEATVFDYLHKHADGTKEGNETGKLIEKQQP